MATAELLVVSFGYLHAPAPAAQVVIDVRTWFRDPHPELVELTGGDPRVVERVMATAGVRGFVSAQADAVAAVLASGVPVTVAVGCAGGRHRSVVIADAIAERVRGMGYPVSVLHWDVDKPVVRR